MTTNVELARKILDLFAKADWKTYRTMIEDNIVYEEEATRRRIQGADQLIEVLKAWKAAFPNLRATEKQHIASGDAVVSEVEWEGTHQGTLTGPFGTIAATNRSGKTPAVLVVRFENGKMRELRHYFDMMTLLAQIGGLPQGMQQPGAR
ncbi:MAG: ester cyclase [Polyangia bacterium]